MSITTRTGDHGTTRLFSGEVVPKDSPRTEAYGTVDELVSQLGVARVHCRRDENRALILQIQRELFIVGSEMATAPDHLQRLKRRIDRDMLDQLDRRREALEQRVPIPNDFIVPGGSLAGAHLDVARTVARRVERLAAGLTRKGMLDNPHLTVWLNRLSDFLYLLARDEEPDPTPRA